MVIAMSQHDTAGEANGSVEGTRDRSGESEPSFTRRTTLRALGAGGVTAAIGTQSVAGNSGNGLFPFDRSGDGFQFDHVYDVVEDLGADPTGEERIDDILAEYVQSNTKLIFPEGTYKLGQFRNNDGPLNCFCYDQYYYLENVWFQGQGSGKTVLKPPDGWGRPDEDHEQPWGTLFWEIRGSNNIRFEGFTIDYTHETTGSRFQIYPENGLYVRDVHQKGMNSNFETSFAFAVDGTDGYGLIQNLRAPDGGRPVLEDDPHEGSGMYVPDRHQGTLELRNCHIEGFQDNGLYASSPGPESRIIVNGGYYANSNISNIRVGWNSVVKNATVVVDERIETDYAVNMRGIRQQDGAGTVVRNCDVIHTADAPSSGAIVSAGRTGDFTVENCRIHVGDPGTTNAINAKSPDGFDADGNEIETESVTVKNVKVTGDAPGDAAVRLSHRDGNTVENVCVEQTGDDRDGLLFEDSSGTVENAVLDVTDEPIVVTGDGEVETSNVRYDGNC